MKRNRAITTFLLFLYLTIMCGCSKDLYEMPIVSEMPDVTVSSGLEEYDMTVKPSWSEQEQWHYGSTAQEAYKQMEAAFGAEDTVQFYYDNYPDFYGGYCFHYCYLVVFMTDFTQENINYIKSLVDEPDVLRFASVMYSYNELLNVRNSILSRRQDDGEIAGVGVVEALAIYGEKNAVTVFIIAEDEDYVRQVFKASFGDRVIVKVTSPEEMR